MPTHPTDQRTAAQHPNPPSNPQKKSRVAHGMRKRELMILMRMRMRIQRRPWKAGQAHAGGLFQRSLPLLWGRPQRCCWGI